MQFPEIDVNIERNSSQDETTYCSILTSKNDTSATNFTQCGWAPIKMEQLLGNERRASMPAKDSTYYGDLSIQNEVVSTTRKRLSDEDVKLAKSDLDASLADQRLRSLRSVSKKRFVAHFA